MQAPHKNIPSPVFTPLLAFALAALLLAPPAPAAAAEADPGLWIVRFAEDSLARYEGDLPGLAATNPQARGEGRLDPASPASRAYLDYLEDAQRRHLGDIERAVGRSVEVVFQYLATYNGAALRMSAAEAEVVATLPGVVSVLPDVHYPLATDAGPSWIGAPSLWDGSATGGLPGSRGEGVVVGIIDSGVNMDHPSFSDSPADGHTFVNPFGSGNFVGWCNPAHPNHQPSYVCNDKLIGAWDFADAVSTDNDGPEDDNGHGSHTASTAAGNTLPSPAISGVAPHANLITYDACYTAPSGQGLCPFSATSASVDQSVLDGVDVINYSISGGTAPWSGDIDTFFFDAAAAGVFVAAAANNTGPAAGTVGHLGPWVTTVGASTHDRVTVQNELVSMTGGMTAPPADITGASRTNGYGPAPIVYAGDFSNGDPNPEQCLNPFSAGTWTNGEIVVCDRGTIARVLKCKHVADGGAAGCVLANVAGSGAIVADPHFIPAIHVEQADGDALKAWLASGSGHMATLTDSAIVSNPSQADVMASFSSRGPNPSFDVVKPDVTNPGVSVFAAWATDPTSGIPGPEFATISGTSMSSPHTAGSAALLKSLRPSWTHSEVKSALVTTADVTVTKDGATPADPFDMGGGRVDLTKAARAGLVLDETMANYLAANPATGGDPKTLNLPSFQDGNCNETCSWTRQVTNATGGALVWDTAAAGPPSLTVTVSPSSFPLAAGATQTIIVTVDVGDLPLNTWLFGEVTLTPTDPTVPATRMPLAVIPTGVNAEIFTDGFESGDTSAWTAAIGN